MRLGLISSSISTVLSLIFNPPSKIWLEDLFVKLKVFQKHLMSSLVPDRYVHTGPPLRPKKDVDEFRIHTGPPLLTNASLFERLFGHAWERPVSSDDSADSTEDDSDSETEEDDFFENSSLFDEDDPRPPVPVHPWLRRGGPYGPPPPPFEHDRATEPLFPQLHGMGPLRKQHQHRTGPLRTSDHSSEGHVEHQDPPGPVLPHLTNDFIFGSSSSTGSVKKAAAHPLHFAKVTSSADLFLKEFEGSFEEEGPPVGSFLDGDFSPPLSSFTDVQNAVLEEEEENFHDESIVTLTNQATKTNAPLKHATRSPFQRRTLPQFHVVERSAPNDGQEDDDQEEVVPEADFFEVEQENFVELEQETSDKDLWDVPDDPLNAADELDPFLNPFAVEEQQDYIQPPVQRGHEDGGNWHRNRSSRRNRYSSYGRPK